MPSATNNDAGTLAALSEWEGLLIALVERKVIDNNEVATILEYVRTAHSEAAISAGDTVQLKVVNVLSRIAETAKVVYGVGNGRGH
jgi:hypothetical protein